MTKIVWDAVGEHIYETGVRNAVLYVQAANGTYNSGVAWNGLTAVTESPSGAEFTPLYADDIKYLNLQSVEEFGATVEAYTYPDEFMQCDGSGSIATGVNIGQQARKSFGLCYRTAIGNDTEGSDHGYKLHIVYGAMSTPSQKSYSTINDNPEAITFSWELNTTPVNVTGFKPTASLTIDSTKVDAAKLSQLEDILYGTSGTDSRLPLPDEIAQLMGTTSIFAVTNYLVNVVTSNESTTASSTYNATLTAIENHTIENVAVVMGDEDITDTAYSAGEITIASVTGAIVIYATANAN